MKRQYLNLTHGAWRQLRRNWQLAPSPILLWQTLAPGTLFSALTGLQRTAAREQLVHANLKDAIVILGYWRSGPPYCTSYSVSIPGAVFLRRMPA